MLRWLSDAGRASREIIVCGQCLVAAAGVHQLRELIASLANVQRKYIAEG